MIVVLLGYMASGKSAVGRQLANKLKYKFIDLDDYIESKLAASIPEIFDEKGEIYFRKIESTSLQEIINKEDDIVLSLGGGTPCYGDNMELINKSDNSISVYLKSSIPTLVNRLKKEKDQRPLVAHISSEDELIEFIGKHLFERSPYYQLAEVVINTNNKTIQAIQEEVILALFEGDL